MAACIIRSAKLQSGPERTSVLFAIREPENICCADFDCNHSKLFEHIFVLRVSDG